MKLHRKLQLAVSVLLMVLGTWQVGAAVYIHAKALLAQQLLLNAWDRTEQVGQRIRPWGWADTWPLAKLEVKQLGIETMVLAGASGRTLAFGPGHIEGTAPLGGSGNSVISGHRDTHFQFLRDLVKDDQIELHLPGGRNLKYAVMRMGIVDQDDTWILGHQINQLTLVTCYPFDAVVPGGRQRYMVVAKLRPENQLIL